MHIATVAAASDAIKEVRMEPHQRKAGATGKPRHRNAPVRRPPRMVFECETPLAGLSDGMDENGGLKH